MTHEYLPPDGQPPIPDIHRDGPDVVAGWELLRQLQAGDITEESITGRPKPMSERIQQAFRDIQQFGPDAVSPAFLDEVDEYHRRLRNE